MATASNFKLFIILFITCTLIFLLFHQDVPSQKKRSLEITNNANFLKARDEWRSCFADKLAKVRDDPAGMWSGVKRATNQCRNETSFSRIELTGVKNKDEMKYHVYSTSEEPSVVLTLGIGLDVKAETTLKDTLPADTRFYAADPIFKGNAELFEPLGPYFPFAVGKDITVSVANVLHEKKYKKMTMPHIDIITFLTKFVKENTIDQFLMDNEGPEYDILPMMAKGKEFDENDIVICQVNTEVHNADEQMKKQFLGIMNTIISDGRYAFLVSYTTVHHRFFFINMEHPYCVDKYFARFF